MANIYGVVALDAAQHKSYGDFVQHTSPLKEGLLQTLSTDNSSINLNSVDSTESVNPLIQLNCSESREMANSLKMLQAPNSGFARRLGNLLEIQKEKGSSANAAFEMTAFLLHEENQNVNRLSFSESDNSPLLRGLVLRNPLRVAQMHTELIGQAIPTTIGGWDLRLCESISPAQTLHTEIIGTQNLQVVKSYSQNHTEIIRKPDGVTRSNPTQPFGSMPRFRSSSRPSSFNQLLVLVFASCAKPSNCLRKSAGMRIGSIGDFPPPLGCLSLVIDMHMPIALTLIQIGIYTNTLKPIKTTPRSAGTHAGRLTKPLNEVTIMACLKSNQTHPKFQYRFLALNRHDKKAKPCRLSVEATTEHEARRILAPHFILSFAARLPATIEKTSTVQEVHHA